MSAEPSFPEFVHRLPNGWPGAVVRPDEWRPLKPHPATGVPCLPPRGPVVSLGQSAISVRDMPMGPARAGQVARAFEMPASHAWPLGILGSEAPTWTVREVVPASWDWSQLLAAYRAAGRIVRDIGLPRAAYQVWCFRDGRGRWWALVDNTGGDFMERNPDVEGLSRLFHRSAAPNMAEAFPSGFAEALGGDGALEWAWWVLGAVRQLSEQTRRVAVAQSEARQLFAMPEWSILVAAVERGGDPVASSALANIRSLAGDGMPEGVGHAFIQGFEIGQALGVSGVMAEVRRHERGRFKGKPELEDLYRAAIAAEAAIGPIKPYDLAKKLDDERGNTARGIAMAKAGLPSSYRTIGARISRLARQDGYLP